MLMGELESLAEEREKFVFIAGESTHTFFHKAEDYMQCCAAACAAAMQLMV